MAKGKIKVSHKNKVNFHLMGKDNSPNFGNTSRKGFNQYVYALDLFISMLEDVKYIGRPVIVQSCFKSKRANLRGLQASLQSLNASLPSLQANLPSLPASLPSFNANLPSLPASLSSLQARLSSLGVNLPSLNASLPSLQANLPNLQACRSMNLRNKKSKHART